MTDKKKQPTLADLRLMATYYLSIMEGDTHMVEDAYAFMHKWGFTDKDGFEIGEDDDN
jgi:hypothetical protein